MVQAKHKKSKTKKQVNVKKHGKQADVAHFRSQLDALGLKVIQVTADGNCFFRALADQLEGSEEEHKKYRRMVVLYILNHREEFEPFIEDDVPFDEYCQSMEKEGTWAGHMELQAASLVTRRNICIHRIMSPRWYIRNYHDDEASMIHLCYHDGEHYNSVRLKEDSCEGPAKPIIIKVDANISATGRNKNCTLSDSKGTSRKFGFDVGSVKLVVAGTGCENINRVKQFLQEVDGDVDAAIEFLIAEEEMNGNVNCNDESSCESNIYDGDNENGNCEQPEVASEDMKCEHNVCSSNFQSVQGHSIRHDEKKIPRNKDCSCGSKKKHKACCGSTTGKSSTAFVMKTKKSRKKEALRETPAHGSEGLPDMGALCI